MDPNRGIMLAHKMNGEPLRPDHGRPLRAVVPGQIGGRSVKWLTKLILTESPSDNWYHIYDNRVLPLVSPLPMEIYSILIPLEPWFLQKWLLKILSGGKMRDMLSTISTSTPLLPILNTVKSCHFLRQVQFTPPRAMHTAVEVDE